jgi:hypothetical protein
MSILNEINFLMHHIYTDNVIFPLASYVNNWCIVLMYYEIVCVNMQAYNITNYLKNGKFFWQSPYKKKQNDYLVCVLK